MRFDENRTTDTGLYHYALSYLEAARALAAAGVKSTHPDEPIRFLYFHAIELFLKAFLRLHGQTLDDLKRLGHKTINLQRACLSLGFEFDDEDSKVIERMDDEDTLIRARYIQTGYFRNLTIEALERTAGSLRERVRTALIAAGRPLR